ncbi:MAG: hypothetical protein WAO98_09785 [Alphaproteobacteria bacterium]
MATISFQVAVKPGTLNGYIDGFRGAVGVYTAKNASLPLDNKDIFCISPNSEAIMSSATYTITPGVVGQTPFTLSQINAIQGITSKYYMVGDTSPAAMAKTVLANWLVVNPDLVITGMNPSIVAAAQFDAQQGLAGNLEIASYLKFTTFVNANSQNFLNVSEVPLPPTAWLMLTALFAVFCVTQLRKNRLRAF